MTKDGTSSQQKPKAVVVGGSIAGVSCAHALIRAGWEVIVLEKSSGPEVGTGTGAGIGLDPLACRIVESWVGSEPLSKVTLPLTIDESRAIDGEKRRRKLTRDECYNYRSAHWADIHVLLWSSLPRETILWGHVLESFDDQGSVTLNVKVLKTGDIIQLSGDLLVAADGSQSPIRQTLLPDNKLRYAGYCAWRGVLDYPEDDDSNTIKGIRKAYPDIGNCLYFNIGVNTHCVLYELPGKKLNWVWYYNQHEPLNMKGGSLTTRLNKKLIEKLHMEAEKVWIPELAGVIRETKEPFMNALYDSDPLEKLVFDNVVLVGDGAHPTTPHSSRSSNAAIIDAAVLGKCLEKYTKSESLIRVRLSEYESLRLPVMGAQVLHSRRVGLIRQGLDVAGDSVISEDVCWDLRQRNTPFFDHVPSLLDLK